MNKVVNKVVIVEDDPSIQFMYKFKLESETFNVRSAFNGEEGLELIEAFRPDLVLLDLRMPLMDGSEMLEKMRATEWGCSIRVIILTNISKSEAPQNLRFLDVSRYVVKAHHTPSQVMAIIHEVLNYKPLPLKNN